MASADDLLLVKLISDDTHLVYPYKYECNNGKFMDESLEKMFRKDITAGQGKAGYKNFNIAVLGRLPKIYADMYLLKIKLQLVLRILDNSTDMLAQVCIPKGDGGVRP